MEAQLFGKTGLLFPPIVFGSGALGNLFHAYPTALKNNILKEILDRTAPHTVFDTAGKYGAGMALEVLGDFLKENRVPERRVIIANKLGWVRTALKGQNPTFEPGIWKGLQHDAVQKISYKGIMECFEKDNALLNGRVPQLIAVHDPDDYLAAAANQEEEQQRWEDVLEAYKALNQLKSEKKVIGIGVGAKNWKTIQQIYNHVKLDYVMLANSLTLFSHSPELLGFVERLRKDQVGIINAAVFHSGFLVGENYFNYKEINPMDPADQEKIQWREYFFKSCHAHGVAPDHACIQFSLAVPGVSSVALSTNKPELVMKNSQAVEEKIPENFWRELIDKGLIPEFEFLF